MVSVGICGFCQQGLKQVVRCPVCQDLYAVCDECDALWLDPSPDALPVFARQPDLPCPLCGGPAGWEFWERVTPSEVVGTPWEPATNVNSPAPGDGERGQD